MKSSRPLMVLFLLVALLAGCATDKDKDADKPWVRKKPKWWESEMDPDDRAFYHDVFSSPNR